MQKSLATFGVNKAFFLSDNCLCIAAGLYLLFNEYDSCGDKQH
jgi:hypothetical protein